MYSLACRSILCYAEIKRYDIHLLFIMVTNVRSNADQGNHSEVSKKVGLFIRPYVTIMSYEVPLFRRLRHNLVLIIGCEYVK